MEADGKPGNFKSEPVDLPGFYSDSKEVELNWVERCMAKIRAIALGNQLPEDDMVTRCLCFRHDGRLIWDSSGLGPELRSLAGLIMGVLVVLLSRPRACSV